MSDNDFCPGCGSTTPGIHVWAGTGRCPNAGSDALDDFAARDTRLHDLKGAMSAAIDAAYQRGLADGAASENEACAREADAEAIEWKGVAARCLPGREGNLAANTAAQALFDLAGKMRARQQPTGTP